MPLNFFLIYFLREMMSTIYDLKHTFKEGGKLDNMILVFICEVTVRTETHLGIVLLKTSRLES